MDSDYTSDSSQGQYGKNRSEMDSNYTSDSSQAQYGKNEFTDERHESRPPSDDKEDTPRLPPKPSVSYDELRRRNRTGP